jgi:hypothetical protein
LPGGVAPGLRWHPSGNSILCISNNAVVATCVKPGKEFGHSLSLTAQGDKPLREELVVSWDGKTIAYTKRIPTLDQEGNRVTTYDGQDCRQIFVLDFPDANGDGIADGKGAGIAGT